MLYLLDTNAFSDLMREHPKMDAHLVSLSGADRLVICTIIRGEIRYGLYRLPVGKRRRELQAKANRLFSVIPCEPISETAADHYADVKLARERKGLAMDENDLWIASMALALDAVLVSRDADFRHIDDLNVEDWSK